MLVEFKKSKNEYIQSKAFKEYQKEDRDIFFKEYIKGKRYYNGINSRVEKTVIEDGKIIFYTQDVEYEEYVKTNIYYLEEYVKKDRIDEFLNAMTDQFASHLGMSCIIKTTDKKYLLTKRGNDLITGGGEIAVSFSGAVEEIKEGSLKDNLGVIVYKEAKEELNIEEVDFKKIELLGILKDWKTGGKINMYFIAEVSLSSKELARRMEGAEDKDEIQAFYFVEEKNIYEEVREGQTGDTIKLMKHLNF